jgi:dihydroorotate dehydrogenase (fumarate)
MPRALAKYGFDSMEEVIQTSLSKHVSYDPIVPSVDVNKCTKCLLCEKICPYFAITFDEQIRFNSEKCFGCHLCVSRCPVGAIHVTHKSKD